MILTLLNTARNYNKVIESQSEFDSLTIEQGDDILLKDTFSGTLTLNQKNVKISGGGLDGSTVITGFSDEGDGSYSKVMTEPNWVHLNGSPMKMAETDWIETTGSGTNTISVNHADVSSYSTIVGSRLIVHYQPWAFSGYKVTAYDGAGTITLDQNLKTTINSSAQIKLLGLTEYFVDNNEFAYESGSLYIKSASSPTNISEPTEDVITITGAGCSVTNVDITGFYKTGIHNAGEQCLIDSCTIHDGRGIGIQNVGLTSQNQFINNTIYDCGYCGIYDYTTILQLKCNSNTIYNIGTFDNRGYEDDSRTVAQTLNCGIQIANPTNKIDYDRQLECNYNNIYNCCYAGIKGSGRNGEYKYNIIHDCMLYTDDGAGLYTWGGNDNSDAPDAFQNTIEYNFIYNCLGSRVGFDGASPSLSMGIYLDDQSIETTTRYNVIYNCYRGIFTKGKDHNFDGNTVYANVEGFQYRTPERTTPPDVAYPNEGNSFNNNILITKILTGYCLVTDLQSPDAGYNPYTGGDADNNYYIKPYGTNIVNEGNDGDIDLAGLKSAFSQDTNSVEHVNYITAPGDPDNEILIITNPTNSSINGSAPSGSWYDVDGTLTTNYTVPAWSSLLLLKDLI